MSWLMPFMIVFIFVVIFDKKNILSKFVAYFMERVGSKIPFFNQLLSCIFCLSFWIALVYVIVTGENYMYIFYITVSASALYNLIRV